MADQIRVNGMILSSRPQGENDKRVVILTKEQGKITAFARGARRPGNHLMAASDSCAFGTFELIRGRDAYTMVNAEIRQYFRELTDDLEAMYTAYYFLELTEYYAVENQDGGEMLNLLYAAFRALLNSKFDKRLVRHIFELKIMVLNGEYPDFFRCVITGEKDPKTLTYFSMARHGMVSEAAHGQAPDAIAVGESTLYTLQFIVCTPIGKLFSFAVTEEVLTELRMVCDRCRHAYLDRSMKALEILETISG